MKAQYVEPRRTPLTFEEARHCLEWALKWTIGKEPSDDVLALSMAKCALETGRWTQMWCNNWGNVKCGPEHIGMFTCITLNEVLKGKLVWFAPEGQLSCAPSKGGKLTAQPLPVPDGHPQTRMRAFANQFSGVEEYVSFVANGRYKSAFAKLLAGDAVGYVHALKVAMYFTADETLYRNGVVALQREMLARIRNVEPPTKVDLEWERLLQIVPGMQFDVAELLGGDFVEAA
jgi:hypothetical protein